MQLSILDTTHPTYDKKRWHEVCALAKGGKKYKELLTTFLPKNPVEPEDVYAQRRQESHFTAYSAGIINLYTSWLFATSFSVKAYKRDSDEPVKELDPFYGQFQEDVGYETQLSAFMKDRFRHALENQVGCFLIEKPSDNGAPPKNALEYEQRGLGRATLKEIDRHELLDWEEDEHGALQWAVLHTVVEDRSVWTSGRDTILETWRVYDREIVRTFQLRYKKNERPRDPKFEVPEIGEAAPHGFRRVPVVRMQVPYELCIGEQTFDPQLEHFRLENALSWLIRRTCYAQPVFNLEDSEGNPPRMGTGYAIVLGKDDKMGWTSPPVAPFDVLQKKLDSKREDIYRIVHQMAQAVDNNAETVGRSADSKEIDAAATRILLNEYGTHVSKAIEETYEIISEARGDAGYEWSVEGFSGYDTATVASLIANATAARGLGIPSKSFHRELCTKTALALLPEVDQRVKDTIRDEITSADFTVSDKPLEIEKLDLLSAKAELDRAKAEAEPIKAKAAMKSASQPKPAPGAAPGGGKPKPAAKK